MKKKILIPILTSAAAILAITPIVALSSCACSSSLKFTWNLDKKDYKPSYEPHPAASYTLEQGKEEIFNQIKNNRQIIVEDIVAYYVTSGKTQNMKKMDFSLELTKFDHQAKRISLKIFANIVSQIDQEIEILHEWNNIPFEIDNFNQESNKAWLLKVKGANITPSLSFPAELWNDNSWNASNDFKFKEAGKIISEYVGNYSSNTPVEERESQEAKSNLGQLCIINGFYYYAKNITIKTN